MNTEITEIRLNDLAVAAGKKRQSSQTGFVHHHYHESNGELQQTIPLVENFLFALALLQTKTIEQMTEAKQIIQKLLHFQEQQRGDFPVYLHEYPECKDQLIGAHLLPVFFSILNDFQTILGEELKQKLILSTKKLLNNCLDIAQSKNLPYNLSLRIAASAISLGRFFQLSTIEKNGEESFDSLRQQVFQTSWCIPSSIADICLSLQMVYGTIINSPWNDFTAHLPRTWHRQSCSYVGPAIRLSQEGFEPQAGLYDLFLGYLSGQYSARAMKEAPYHLQAALIRNNGERLPVIEYPASFQGEKWEIYQTEKYGYSLCEKSVLTNTAHENLFHPLYLVWGNSSHAHTFVSQAGNFESISFSSNAGEIVITGKLAAECFPEEREKNREQAFYLDIDPKAKITVEGMSASTFSMDESCEIKAEELSLSIVTRIIDGEGQFIGHVMRGNRPSQIQLKNEHRFKAYDWQLFLRALRRGESCTLETKISVVTSQNS